MALAKVLSCAVIDLDGELIEVEVDIGGGGQVGLFIVGLPDAAVQELPVPPPRREDVVQTVDCALEFGTYRAVQDSD